MKAVIDVGIVRSNLKSRINNKLFNWIDIRHNFFNHGLSILEDLIKVEKIGIFTDDINNALKIRNINKYIPIILTKIDNIEQIYDVIMNDLILSVDDIDLFNKIINLGIKDKIELAIKININNYEDGMSIKNYNKLLETVKLNKLINIYLVYTKVNNIKYNDISDFEQLINKEQISSFVIGKDVAFTSDGFISKELFNNAIEFKLLVDKCYKLTKGDIFVNTKIRKDCFGIKIIADNIGQYCLRSLKIDNENYKVVYVNDDTMFLIGKTSVKSNKTICVPDKNINNYHVFLPTNYKLNDKNVIFTIFN